MVSVRNIHGRNLREDLRDLLSHRLVVNHPERVSEAFRSSHEVVFRLTLGHFRYDRIQVLPMRISKEHRLHVRIQYTHMFHSVFFFIASGQLMLFDASFQIIIYPCSHNQTVLGFRLFTCQSRSCSLRSFTFRQDRLCIDIVLLFGILHEPMILFEQLKLLRCSFIYPRIMLICSRLKIDLRFDDVI